jgi:hypothetical protein
VSAQNFDLVDAALPGKRYRNCKLAAQLPSSLMPPVRITSPQRLLIAEAARRYADNDLDRLRRRKLRLHRGGCEIDAEHEQRGTEGVSRKAGNPDHTVAPCPGARFGQKSFIRGQHRSAVRMHHDIDEPARTRLHLGQRVIDLRQRIGARDQLGQIEHTNLRHLGHRLALSGGEPV